MKLKFTTEFQVEIPFGVENRIIAFNLISMEIF